MNDCIFCKIVKKEAPATIVFEDADILAIVPLGAIAKGHTLVIPKVHSENVFDISHTDLASVAAVAKDLSKKIVAENNATGVNLLNASGKDAQQSVFHFHLHIVPRYPNDGYDLWLKAGL